MHLHRAPPARRIRHVIRGIRYNWAIVLRVPVFKILRRPRRAPRRVLSPTVHAHTAVVAEYKHVPDIIRVVAVPVHVRVVRFMGCVTSQEVAALT